MKKPDLSDVIVSQLTPNPPAKIGVAVSGGGDSMALLVLMSDFAKAHAVELHAVSVDHGLRIEAKEEIRLVSDLCEKLGLSHHVLCWAGWNKVGNLQSCARDARYDLIKTWADENDISTIALGHTANDQAETMLMRLARGAGVDGLAAIAPERHWRGIVWIRPLLGEERETLRIFLRTNQIIWADDPSNENRDFERIRMRDAVEDLAPLGVTVDQLSVVAQNMADAKEALDWYTTLAANDVCFIQHGVIGFDLKLFNTLPLEVRRRLLIKAVMWIRNTSYPPRRGAIKQAQEAINKGVSATLDGCQITCKQAQFFVFRELNSVGTERCGLAEDWDGRWVVSGPVIDPSLTVAPFGEKGLRKTPEWRDLELPRAAVASLPAVWRGADLIALPALAKQGDWHVELQHSADTFFATLLSH